MKPKWRATRYVIMLCSSGAHLTAAHKFGCAICAHIANETDFDVASRPHKSLAFAAGPTGRSVQVFFFGSELDIARRVNRIACVAQESFVNSTVNYRKECRLQ